MRARAIAESVLCVLLTCARIVRGFEWPPDAAEAQIVRRVVAECLERDARACLAEKLARAVEQSLDWDVPLFDGLTLKRNDVKMAADASTARRAAPIDRLYDAVAKFIDAHTLTFDVDEASPRTADDISLRGGGGGFGGGGFGGGKKKISKSERRRVQYALFVLLGIFGLTVPLMLKALGLMAGKALISSKIALIMLGSIALKKIFQADHHSPVKVHTHTVPIHDDDHDRYDYYGAYNYYPTHKYPTKAPIRLV